MEEKQLSLPFEIESRPRLKVEHYNEKWGWILRYDNNDCVYDGDYLLSWDTADEASAWAREHGFIPMMS